jgi:hypothetical protein
VLSVYIFQIDFSARRPIIDGPLYELARKGPRRPADQKASQPQRRPRYKQKSRFALAIFVEPTVKGITSRAK